MPQAVDIRRDARCYRKDPVHNTVSPVDGWLRAGQAVTVGTSVRVLLDGEAVIAYPCVTEEAGEVYVLMRDVGVARLTRT